MAQNDKYRREIVSPLLKKPSPSLTQSHPAKFELHEDQDLDDLPCLVHALGESVTTPNVLNQTWEELTENLQPERVDLPENERVSLEKALTEYFGEEVYGSKEPAQDRVVTIEYELSVRDRMLKQLHDDMEEMRQDFIHSNNQLLKIGLDTVHAMETFRTLTDALTKYKENSIALEERYGELRRMWVANFDTPTVVEVGQAVDIEAVETPFDVFAEQTKEEVQEVIERELATAGEQIADGIGEEMVEVDEVVTGDGSGTPLSPIEESKAQVREKATAIAESMFDKSLDIIVESDEEAANDTDSADEMSEDEEEISLEDDDLGDDEEEDSEEDEEEEDGEEADDEEDDSQEEEFPDIVD